MSKFIKQEDGSYVEASSIGDIGTKVVDDTEDFNISATGAPPVYCEDLTSESDCLAAGCYWYENGCHSQPPGIVCSDYITESSCTAHGCYWYDDACHSSPQEVVELPWAIILATVGGIIAVVGAIFLIRR